MGNSSEITEADEIDHLHYGDGNRERGMGWVVRGVVKDFPWELPCGPRWQRWRRRGSDFRTRRECRESSWGTQKASPLRAPQTIPPPQGAPTSWATSSRRPGTPCVNLTPGTTSPSFEFAPPLPPQKTKQNKNKSKKEKKKKL